MSIIELKGYTYGQAYASPPLKPTDLTGSRGVCSYYWAVRSGKTTFLDLAWPFGKLYQKDRFSA